MPTARSGIPTTFRDTNFRSRLEARWAAFFDLVGWRWVYEPFDTGGWIPDFLITGASPFLVEVGACVTRADYVAKAQKPFESGEPLVIVLGVNPADGYLHLVSSGIAIKGLWARCGYCQRIGIRQEHHFLISPCEHDCTSGGDIHLGALYDRDLSHWWALAGNEVQWRPR